MRLGYNTNGLPHHRWQDALDLIAEAGYQSVALTVDHHCLNPYAPGFREELSRVKRRLEANRLSCVIETGARFLLNARIKHEPTLVSATADDRRARVDFLTRCIDMAGELNADAVSLWSGVLRDGAPSEVAWHRLTTSLFEVLAAARRKSVRLAFEPEPGMLVATFADFAELRRLLPDERLGLTVDIGHVQCVESGAIAGHLEAWAPWIWNLHIEDMVRGVHEHLRFGEGEIDFPPVFAALARIGYAGGVHVELSRHGHLGPEMLVESMTFLRNAIATSNQRQAVGG